LFDRILSCRFCDQFLAVDGPLFAVRFPEKLKPIRHGIIIHVACRQHLSLPAVEREGHEPMKLSAVVLAPEFFQARANPRGHEFLDQFFPVHLTLPCRDRRRPCRRAHNWEWQLVYSSDKMMILLCFFS
jgi:hypothetical protein